jgi:predicted TIM-barrel fold metal-dependent hydrolase
MNDTAICRRGFIAHVVAAATATNAGITQAQTDGANAVPFSSGTSTPRFAVPPLACDSHMHIYDSRFPVAPAAKLRPADATVGDYRRLQRRLGTTRNVVVTPSTYGTDNSCLLDALSQFGGTARGVAVVDTSVTDGELKRLDAAGVRGVRFNLAIGSVTPKEMIEPIARRIAALGWHVQVNMNPDELAASESMLQGLPVPIVFDHIGHLPQPNGLEHPGFAVISRLLVQRRAWVKLSGAYLGSKAGAPDYADNGAVASALIRLAPDRMVWGSDWPHPTEHEKPDDAALLEMLHRWAPHEPTWRRILVANPATLYGFREAH